MSASFKMLREKMNKLREMAKEGRGGIFGLYKTGESDGQGTYCLATADFYDDEIAAYDREKEEERKKKEVLESASEITAEKAVLDVKEEEKSWEDFSISDSEKSDGGETGWEVGSDLDVPEFVEDTGKIMESPECVALVEKANPYESDNDFVGIDFSRCSFIHRSDVKEELAAAEGGGIEMMEHPAMTMSSDAMSVLTEDLLVKFYEKPSVPIGDFDIGNFDERTPWFTGKSIMTTLGQIVLKPEVCDYGEDLAKPRIFSNGGGVLASPVEYDCVETRSDEEFEMVPLLEEKERRRDDSSWMIIKGPRGHRDLFPLVRGRGNLELPDDPADYVGEDMSCHVESRIRVPKTEIDLLQWESIRCDSGIVAGSLYDKSRIIPEKSDYTYHWSQNGACGDDARCSSSFVHWLYTPFIRKFDGWNTDLEDMMKNRKRSMGEELSGSRGLLYNPAKKRIGFGLYGSITTIVLLIVMTIAWCSVGVALRTIYWGRKFRRRDERVDLVELGLVAQRDRSSGVRGIFVAELSEAR